MGIKDLHKFLKDNCGEVYVETHLSNYAYKKVAIDISTYIYKYKNVFREHWLHAILKLLTCLRRNKIHPVVVFDSKNPIEAKKVEFERRKEQREKQLSNITVLKEAIKNYEKDKTFSEVLESFAQRSLLTPDRVKVDLKAARAKLDKMEQNHIKISDDDIKNFQKLLTLLKIPWFMDEAEAEKICALMCINGQVDAVLSEDTDVLAYGTPKFLFNLNTASQVLTEIRFDNVINSLEIEREKFLDFCILCGTDYNKRIRGIGPKKAFDLLEMTTLEEMSTVDFDYEYIRKLFTNFDECKGFDKVDYCSVPDWEELGDFLFKQNIRYDITLLRNAVEPLTKFIEDEIE